MIMNSGHVREAAQHGADDAAHQRAVALVDMGEGGMRALAVELLVERPGAAQHAVEQVGRDAAGCEAGGFVADCLRVSHGCGFGANA